MDLIQTTSHKEKGKDLNLNENSIQNILMLIFF